jgi:ketosteroid isomerase-like protein
LDGFSSFSFALHDACRDWCRSHAGAKRDARQYSRQRQPEAIQIAPGGALAYAASRWGFAASLGEQLMAFSVRCTRILKKGGDGWQLMHFHKSVDLPC